MRKENNTRKAKYYCFLSCCAMFAISVLVIFMDKDTSKLLLKELKAFKKQAGNQREAARLLGISNSYMCELMSGTKLVSHEVAERLGFRWKLERISDPT